MSTRIEGQMVIGKYVIRETQDGLRIYLLDDGEGGIFDAEALEKVIDAFYRENF